ncbi:hypothetical protein ACTG9Q_11380 [Actinokineospora sp. 24-640]
MSGPNSDRDEDSPVFRDADRWAERVDRAETPGERRRAWAGFLPRGAAVIIEGLLRDSMVYGAVVFSIIVAVLGATSGDLPWAVAAIASGVLGIGLAVLTHLRRWSVGRQWAVLGAVVLVQVALMVFFWKIHN